MYVRQWIGQSSEEDWIQFRNDRNPMNRFVLEEIDSNDNAFFTSIFVRF